MQKRILNKQKFWNLIQYRPTPNQRAVHSSRARFRINIQGRRSGKSFSAAREIEPWILTPKTRGWIVAPNYELCDKIARIVKDDLLLKLKLPVEAKKEISGQIYYFKMAGLGSEVWIRSCDNVDSLVGEGLDWMIIDEAAKVKKVVWEQYLRPTLSDRKGWVLMTTTPEGHNWMYDCYTRGQSKEFPDWESWQHPSWESPYFKEDIDDIKKTLTKETWEQEYGASFVSFTGRVYPFSRHTNVIKGLKYNPDLPLYCSIDFGFRMPSVGWYNVQEDETGVKIYQVDEICFEENIKTDELANMILRKNYPVEAYYCDPAGAGIQSSSGTTEIQIMRRKGIVCRYKTDKVSRNIANGVTHVRSFIEDAHGDSHFFVSDKCKGAIECYENYRYPEHRVDQRLKEEPLKDGRVDHMNDCTRYFFVNRFPIKRRTAGVIDW